MSIAFARNSNYGIGTTVTFPGGNSNGNLIVVGIFQSQTTVDSVTGVTDLEGNTYVRAAGATQPDSQGSGYYVYYYAFVTNGSNGIGPDNTITVAGSNTPYHIVAVEYSGVVSSSPVDSSGGSGDNGTNTLSYGITLTLTNELIVSMTACQGLTAQNWSGLSGTPRAGSNIGTTMCFFDDFVNNLSGLNTVTTVDDGANSYPAGFSVSFLPSSQGVIVGPRPGYGMTGRRRFSNLVG